VIDYSSTPELKKDIDERAEKDPDFNAINRDTYYYSSFRPMEFHEENRKYYRGEVGKKDGHYIYHFFPKEGSSFPDNFEDTMGDAFIEVFRNKERLEAAFSSEMNSWAVRARNYARQNMFGDELAMKVFDVLDHLLQARRVAPNGRHP
jgi:hypothetical protein